MAALQGKTKSAAYTRAPMSSPFSFLMDISQAHRLILAREQDWGLLAYVLDNENEIWLNCVESFGISSATY